MYLWFVDFKYLSRIFYNLGRNPLSNWKTWRKTAPGRSQLFAAQRLRRTPRVHSSDRGWATTFFHLVPFQFTSLEFSFLFYHSYLRGPWSSLCFSLRCLSLFPPFPSSLVIEDDVTHGESASQVATGAYAVHCPALRNLRDLAEQFQNCCKHRGLFCLWEKKYVVETGGSVQSERFLYVRKARMSNWVLRIVELTNVPCGWIDNWYEGLLFFIVRMRGVFSFDEEVFRGDSSSFSIVIHQHKFFSTFCRNC